ncbi:MAG TPA: DUF4105 domain-containing protein [Nevskiaceae bacterium]|nr:DUF4105 domain-containing protein [Nevskiaceae bacterium]
MRGRYVVASGIAAAVAAWMLLVRPSNDRDWRVEESRMPSATVDGHLVTIHDIRNFDYRSETDFTPGWYDKTFDLDQLDSVDLLASYWMGPDIAHIFLSFGFGDDHVAVSIEARKERGEGYSSVKGFFRQYELYYVVADERDAVRVRTNFRKDPPEDVYLYPVNGPRENLRRLFLAYVDQINRLHDRPRFYNTLTTNCTTAIWMNTRVNPGHVPFSWKVLASGHVPAYLYEQGRLDTSRPFEELRARALINARARAAGAAPDFSRRIRE